MIKKNNSQNLKRMFLILIMLNWVFLLFPQLEKKDILLKKAKAYVDRSRYTEAIEVYETLLADFPDDYEIISELIPVLFKISNFEEIGKILDSKQEIIPSFDLVKYKLNLLLMQGQMKEAEKLAKEFLKKHSGTIHYYYEIARIFERMRQNEPAIEFLLQARNIANDELLNARELARNYKNAGNLEKAVEENLKYLEKSEKHFYFVVRQIKDILKLDVSQLETVERIASRKKRKDFIEIYALCLAEVGKFTIALEKFESLELSRLRKFAENNLAAGNLQVAKQAFSMMIKKQNSPIEIAETKVNIAEINIFQHKPDSAEAILLEVYQNKEIQKKKIRYKTKVNRLCREMLGFIYLQQGKPQETVLKYFEEAKEFAINRSERKKIDLKIIHYLIMKEDYETAKDRMENILQNEEAGTDIFKLSYFYSYLIASMENDPIADSLLLNLVVNIPERELTNDAIRLNDLVSNIDPEMRSPLLKAYRRKNLFHLEEAISLLDSLFASTKNERILFMIGEWSLEGNDRERAQEVFQYDYTDEILSEYAALKLVKLSNTAERQQKITDFLKQKPFSIFAPEFRSLLQQE